MLNNQQDDCSVRPTASLLTPHAMSLKKQPVAGDSALSRRERQVMDILHRRRGATVAEIMTELPDPPTYSAVRSVLRILCDKALVRFEEDGPRYVYHPAQSTETTRKDVLAHVVQTYFAGSTESAVTALLQMSDVSMTDEEVARLRQRVSRARDHGK